MKRFISVVAALFILLFVTYPIIAGEGEDEILYAVRRTMKYTPSTGFVITVDKLRKMIKDGDEIQIVDVRPRPESYEKGHIPGAIYIPFNAILEEENLKKLSKDKKIILYCSTGHLQGEALFALRMLGYRVYALRWGMLSWAKTELSEQAIDEIKKGMNSQNPVQKGISEKLKRRLKERAIRMIGC